MRQRFAFPTSVEEILADPNKFGVPTFAQFKRNPDVYRPRKDRYLAAFSQGPENFRKNLKGIRFFCHGKELRGEEDVERMLLDHGYTMEDIDLENKGTRLKKTINFKPVQGGLDHEVHVNFLP